MEMPIMNVHCVEGSLTDAQKADLSERLTALMIQMEGGAGTEGGHAFAWVIYDEIRKGNWWAGGRVDSRYVRPPGCFLVEVRIPEGYMNTQHKNEVQSGVNAALMAATGQDMTADNAGGSCQVVITEVTEGDWACAGRPISIASIAGSVGLSKTGERFAWVESYFAAKAREYKAAGFPADTGGLLPPSP
jgi:phenylpyruvate tautomerase PptA (4-oxalocrotonate tautomerase family)